MTVVESCEILQGELRRRLRATRREEADAPPFPEGCFGSKKPGSKPRDGA
jgi:hypothetical protein